MTTYGAVRNAIQKEWPKRVPPAWIALYNRVAHLLSVDDDERKRVIGTTKQENAFNNQVRTARNDLRRLHAKQSRRPKQFVTERDF